jgi:hypothetical protein
MAETVEYKPDNPNTAFEERDWRLGPVGWIFVATLALLVVSPLVLWWAYPQAVSDTGRRLLVEPPAPRLQISPAEDLARFRAAEDRKLNTYYWIDRQKGVVHIPIAAAMRKLARDGIPGFPKGGP